MERKIAFLAGFFYPVEVNVRTRFARLVANEKLIWVSELSSVDQKIVREPDLSRFKSLLSGRLNSGCDSILVLISNPYSRGFESAFRESVAAFEHANTSCKIEFPPALGPVEFLPVYEKLLEFFGPASAEALELETSMETALGAGKALCISNSSNESVRMTLKHVGLTQKQWATRFEERRIVTRHRGAPVGRALVEDVLRLEPGYSHLLWCVGYPPSSILGQYERKLTWGDDALDAVVSLLKKARQLVQEEDYERARIVQESLHPKRFKHPNGFDISWYSLPARIVGGDCLHILDLDGDKVGLGIGDASGKGMGAAVCISNFHGLVRALASQKHGPGELCRLLNSMLVPQSAPGQFVTFFYGQLDPARKTLTYANAGHNYPILVGADGRVRSLQAGGMVLGILADQNYMEEEVALRPGDRLLLFTDGITEAIDESEKQFGDERLIELLHRANGASAYQVNVSIMRAVSEFCRGNFLDDASLVTVLAKADNL